MKRPDKRGLAANTTTLVVFALPVIWLGLIGGSCAAPGRKLFDWINAFSIAIETPWRLSFNQYSIKAALIALAAYVLFIVLYQDSQRKRRPGEEYGTAEWGTAEQIDSKYRYHDTLVDRLKDMFRRIKSFYVLCAEFFTGKLTKEERQRRKEQEELAVHIDQNIPLTMHTRIGLDVFRHQRNLNMMVIGGSGTGKSRSVSKPEIAQANCSYIICDPKGELLRDCAEFLLHEGYDIKVFNLKEGHRRCGNMYNPFHYLRSEADCVQLVTLLFRATTPKGTHSSDPFWERAEETLITALVLYLYLEGEPEDKNFATIMFLLRNAQASEEDESARNPVDELFMEVEAEKGAGHIAVQYWQAYKLAAGKTAKSILIMASSRLKHFMLSEIADMTMEDEMDLASLGERKRAIFICTPVNDTSFNYLVSMMYMQAFQQLYDRAEQKYGGRLPHHVRFIMDEFYNTPPPDRFDNVLSTCRSYNLSCAVILQDIGQIKTMFEKEWESLIAQCDQFLYLGGNDTATYKYVSERLGKETIFSKTTSLSRGTHGSSSQNDQKVGTDLMTPDAIGKMDNQYSILFVRGERPIFDEKYVLQKHPNVQWLAGDGKAKAYSPPEHIPFHKYHVEIPADEIDEKYKPEEIGGVLFEYFVIPPQSPQKGE
ncbi:MAG: VirD4-like conjugal transfer protein, CD1115 family [Agathobaculum sp.]